MILSSISHRIGKRISSWTSNYVTDKVRPLVYYTRTSAYRNNAVRPASIVCRLTCVHLCNKLTLRIAFEHVMTLWHAEQLRRCRGYKEQHWIWNPEWIWYNEQLPSRSQTYMHMVCVFAERISANWLSLLLVIDAYRKSTSWGIIANFAPF